MVELTGCVMKVTVKAVSDRSAVVAGLFRGKKTRGNITMVVAVQTQKLKNLTVALTREVIRIPPCEPTGAHLRLRLSAAVAVRTTPLHPPVNEQLHHV